MFSETEQEDLIIHHLHLKINFNFLDFNFASISLLHYHIYMQLLKTKHVSYKTSKTHLMKVTGLLHLKFTS